MDTVRRVEARKDQNQTKRRCRRTLVCDCSNTEGGHRTRERLHTPVSLVSSRQWNHCFVNGGMKPTPSLIPHHGLICAITRTKKIHRRLRPTPRLFRTSSSRWCSIHATLSWSRSSTNVMRESTCNIQRQHTTQGASPGGGSAQNTYQEQEVVPRVAPAGLAAAKSHPTPASDERRLNGETARVGGSAADHVLVRISLFFLLHKGTHQDLRPCVLVSVEAERVGEGRKQTKQVQPR